MVSQVVRTEQITVTEEEYKVIKDFCEALKDYVCEINDDSDWLYAIIDTLGTYEYNEEKRIAELAKMDFCIKVEKEEKNEEN